MCFITIITMNACRPVCRLFNVALALIWSKKLIEYEKRQVRFQNDELITQKTPTIPATRNRSICIHVILKTKKSSMTFWLHHFDDVVLSTQVYFFLYQIKIKEIKRKKNYITFEFFTFRNWNIFGIDNIFIFFVKICFSTYASVASNTLYGPS